MTRFTGKCCAGVKSGGGRKREQQFFLGFDQTLNQYSIHIVSEGKQTTDFTIKDRIWTNVLMYLIKEGLWGRWDSFGNVDCWLQSSTYISDSVLLIAGFHMKTCEETSSRSWRAIQSCHANLINQSAFTAHGWHVIDTKTSCAEVTWLQGGMQLKEEFSYNKWFHETQAEPKFQPSWSQSQRRSILGLRSVMRKSEELKTTDIQENRWTCGYGLQNIRGWQGTRAPPPADHLWSSAAQALITAR